eukprot:7390795-Prymnesium_polylepis.1
MPKELMSKVNHSTLGKLNKHLVQLHTFMAEEMAVKRCARGDPCVTVRTPVQVLSDVLPAVCTQWR